MTTHPHREAATVDLISLAGQLQPLGLHGGINGAVNTKRRSPLVDLDDTSTAATFANQRPSRR
jgi:hypothetical protein